MKEITNLSGLLTDNLKKLYSSEQQQLEGLKKIQSKANSNSLRTTISFYLKSKDKNIDRLKQSFDALKMSPEMQKCEIVQTLLSDCSATISQTAEEHVRDAGLISTIQQINHFNIANYGTLASFAKALNKTEVAKLLHEALEDEKATDIKLSDIAKKTVNPLATLVA